MLKPETVAEVKRLIAAGDTMNAVAKKLSISRGSVQAIAANRRRLKRHSGNEAAKSRCPECGAMVFGICLACQIRRSAVCPVS